MRPQFVTPSRTVPAARGTPIGAVRSVHDDRRFGLEAQVVAGIETCGQPPFPRRNITFGAVKVNLGAQAPARWRPPALLPATQPGGGGRSSNGRWRASSGVLLAAGGRGRVAVLLLLHAGAHLHQGCLAGLENSLKWSLAHSRMPPPGPGWRSGKPSGSRHADLAQRRATGGLGRRGARGARGDRGDDEGGGGEARTGHGDLRNRTLPLHAPIGRFLRRNMACTIQA